ncbi:hypothetical protein FF1_023121 [Malus domestica]
MEEIMSELMRGSGEGVNEHGMQPGFRFHPTDEELITFFLASKVYNGSFCGVRIAEVDLNRCEPWELPDVAKMGDREWYFFSLRDRKYPTGMRTNRATGAGYWKATGKDRQVFSASTGALLGMKKTLVFYKGRAPRGHKTKWVMHEYRLDGHFSSYRHACKEEWVICRINHKSGDKESPLLVDHEAAASMNSNCNYLPPLLDPSPALALQESCHEFQNPMQLQVVPPPIHQDNHDPFSFFPAINALQTHQLPSFSNSLLFKSLFEQDCNSSSSTSTIPKQCKTELANYFSRFQTPDNSNNNNNRTCNKLHNLNFRVELEKNHAHQYQPNAPYHNRHQYNDPLPFDYLDYSTSVLGFSAAEAITTTITARATVHAHDTAPSVAFDKAGFQTMLDLPPIKLPGESCRPYA